MKCPHCHKDIKVTDDEAERIERAKARAEIMRINEEYREHNPSVFLKPSRDPSEFECRLVIVAAPLGLLGTAFDGSYMGPMRDTKLEALRDAEHAAPLIARAGFTALQYLWQEERDL